MKSPPEPSRRLTQAAKVLEKAHKRKMYGISAFNTALIAFTRVHEQALPGKKVEHPTGSRQTERNPA
jgi:hypothetical protein